MTAFAKRNLKIFFRDKSAVFFSLMAVFIIIALYVLFLGDVWTENFNDVKNAGEIMDSWIVAGILAVTSITTTMGAFGTMVNDKATGIIKDLYASPIKRSSIAGGYILSSFIIGLIMSLIAAVVCEIYIVANGGNLMSASMFFKAFIFIILSTAVNTSVVFFMVSFFKSQNAFATASTIIGTIIGFVMGIYLPVGVLPEAVQTVIKCFPLSYEATLLRQTIMEKNLDAGFGNLPPEYLDNFKETMGIEFSFEDTVITQEMSIVILLVTGLIFFLLSLALMKKKKK